MTVTCTGAQCTIVSEAIYSGTANYYDVNFSFDSVWNSLTKKVFFIKNDIIEKVTLTSSSCKLPTTITASAGNLYIGIMGSIVDDEGTPLIDEQVILTTPYVFATTIKQGVI